MLYIANKVQYYCSGVARGGAGGVTAGFGLSPKVGRSKPSRATISFLNEIYKQIKLKYFSIK